MSTFEERLQARKARISGGGAKTEIPATAMPGLDALNTLTADQVRERQSLQDAGRSSLVLRDGRRIHFRHIYIPPEKHSLVVPSDHNIRQFDQLTEVRCADIINTARVLGLRYELLATYAPEHNLYSVFDGSRRLWSALHLGIGFDLRYTEDHLTPAEMRECSALANIRQENSIIELGKFFIQQMQDEGITEQTQLTKIYGFPGSIISEAIQSARIPPPIIQLFPSPMELGRPALQRIRRLVRAAVESDGDDVGLITAASKAGAQATNSAAMAFLEATQAKQPAPQTGHMGNNRMSIVGRKRIQIELASPEAARAVMRALSKHWDENWLQDEE